MQRVTLMPRDHMPRRGTLLHYVRWVRDPGRCSHITAMCERCRPEWERLFHVGFPDPAGASTATGIWRSSADGR